MWEPVLCAFSEAEEEAAVVQASEILPDGLVFGEPARCNESIPKTFYYETSY